jgi:hypothetical protein
MKSDTFIMVEGTTALIEKLGIIEAERYISNLRNTEPFDYTEWRQENLWKGMSAEDILLAAAEFDKNNPRPVLKCRNSADTSAS